MSLKNLRLGAVSLKCCFVMLVAGVPLARAEIRTASGVVHSRSIELGVGSNGAYRLYFSTYDGVHTSARYPHNGEFRPDSLGSASYRTDYDVYYPLYAQYVGYGSATMTFPTTDANADALPDFLDVSRSGSFSATGSATEYISGYGTSAYSLTGTFSRSPGSYEGTYSLISSSGATPSGRYYINGGTGSATYDTAAKTIVFAGNSFSWTVAGSGTATYEILNQNSVRVNAFVFSTSDGFQRSVNSFTLTRSGNKYFTTGSLVDGDPETSWVDYKDFHIAITDANDFDGDGIPDLSDPPTTSPPVINSHPQGQTVVGGQSVALAVAATGTGLAYQWKKDGAALNGAVASSHGIVSAARVHAGVYTVTVSNLGGSVTSSSANLRVMVPQRMERPEKLAGGTFKLRFGDTDGGLLADADKNAFTFQWSTNFAQWFELTNATRSVVGGKVELQDTDAVGRPHRFYRVIER